MKDANDQTIHLLKEQIDSLTNKNAVLEDLCAEQHRVIQGLEEEEEQQQEEVRDLQTAHETAKQTISYLTGENTTLTQDLADAGVEAECILMQTKKSMADTIRKLRGSKKQLSNELASANAAKDEANEDWQRMERAVVEANREKTEMTAKLAEAQQSINRLHAVQHPQMPPASALDNARTHWHPNPCHYYPPNAGGTVGYRLTTHGHLG